MKSSKHHYKIQNNDIQYGMDDDTHNKRRNIKKITLINDAKY